MVIPLHVRIPEFVVKAFMRNMTQTSYLALCHEAPAARNEQAVARLRAVAQRIARIFEDGDYALRAGDRELLNADAVLPAVAAVRAEWAGVPHATAFVVELERSFEAIRRTQEVQNAWVGFLAGREPELDDRPYSFELPRPLSCNFCGKSQAEVQKLIAGPSVFICDECITLCEEIIAEDKGSAGEPEHRP